MKAKTTIVVFLTFIFGCVFGYFAREFKGEMLFNNMLRSSTNKEVGFYKVFDYRTENMNNLNADAYGRSGIKGLAYCKFIDENNMKLPEEFGGYIKIGDNFFYEGNYVTTCKNCQKNDQLSYMLYDGKTTYYEGEPLSGFIYKDMIVLYTGYNKIFTDSFNTYYDGKILSGFNSHDFILLDDKLALFTDKKSTYYKNTLVTGLDYSSFQMLNPRTPKFRDKNYIYTLAEQTPDTPLHFIVSTGTAM